MVAFRIASLRALLPVAGALAAGACHGNDDSHTTTALGAGGAANAIGGETGGGAAAADAAPLECGKEFEPCCTGSSERSCEAQTDLRCNDSACVVCSHVPSPLEGCTNVAPAGAATADLVEKNDVTTRGPTLAIDGDACTFWGSGDFPADADAGIAETAWQVDLGAPHTIDAMTLWLAMTPAGPVNLEIRTSVDGSTWQTEWSGTRDMSGNEPWRYPTNGHLVVRHVRVVFFTGPSWVAIRELALFECGAGDAGTP